MRVYVGRVWRVKCLVIIARREWKAGITGLSWGAREPICEVGPNYHIYMYIYISMKSAQEERHLLTHTLSASCISRVYSELEAHPVAVN